MSTGSTRRRNRKQHADDWGATKGGRESNVPPPKLFPEERGAGAAAADADRLEISGRTWLIASLLILLVAAALRLYALELKPLHHDEGVNGFFLTNLVRGLGYKYDPTNYHGPTLYYFSLPFVWLIGLNTFAVRLLTVVFGVATVWLLLGLRRYVGTVGALAAAALVAVSPGAVYYSRYYIHETLFVFFTLGIVVAALRFYETRSAFYMMMLAASAAMLFATKETAFISVGVLLLAWLVAWYWVKWMTPKAAASPREPRGKRRKQKSAGASAEDDFGLRSVLASFGGAERAAYLIASAIALFVLLNMIFYSSFFKNWKGVSDAVAALNVWTKTGASAFHAKPLHTYVKWLLQEEAPILILAATGSAAALFERRKRRFAIFAGAWAFGTLAAYSLIPYKTPWLMLNFIVPMAVAAGYALGAFDRIGPAGAKARTPVLIVAACALAFATYQSLVLNFRHYDDDRYPYVYSHSRRELHDLVAEVERLAARTGRGRDTGISIAAPEYWPLPWYLRDYKGVAYDTRIQARYDPQVTPIVIGRDSDIASENQMPRLNQLLAADYQLVNIYDLRPGVRLAVFARRDLVQGR